MWFISGLTCTVLKYFLLRVSALKMSFFGVAIFFLMKFGVGSKQMDRVGSME